MPRLKFAFYSLLSVAICFLIKGWSPLAEAKVGVGQKTQVNPQTNKTILSIEKKEESNTRSPASEVERITREILNLIADNKESYISAPNTFIEAVDKRLSPIVAFNSMAKGVLGKYSQKTSNEQKKQFEKIFKESMLNFYGKALLKLGTNNLTITNVNKVSTKDLNDYKQGKIRQVNVSMSVKTDNKVFNLLYSMIIDNKRWKLRNVNIDGFNVGRQFRAQFVEAVSKYNSVEFVINHWPTIMAGKTPSNK